MIVRDAGRVMGMRTRIGGGGDGKGEVLGAYDVLCILKYFC